MSKLYKILNKIIDLVNNIPTAITNSLTAAKESGEFNGSDGVSVTHEWDGTTLKVTSASGATSADLKGEPGNSGVHFGSDEPKDDSSKVWIDLSSQGDVLDYVPSPDTAEVGQTLVVKAVDESGKPTQYEAADFPLCSGGIEKLIDFTTTEPTMGFQIPIDTDDLRNRLLHASEIHLYLYIPRNAEDTESTTEGTVSVGMLSVSGYRPAFISFEKAITNPQTTYIKHSTSIAKIFVDTFATSLERATLVMKSIEPSTGGVTTTFSHRVIDLRGVSASANSYLFVDGTQTMATGTRFVLGVRE